MPGSRSFCLDCEAAIAKFPSTPVRNLLPRINAAILNNDGKYVEENISRLAINVAGSDISNKSQLIQLIAEFEENALLGNVKEYVGIGSIVPRTELASIEQLSSKWIDRSGHVIYSKADHERLQALFADSGASTSVHINASISASVGGTESNLGGTNDNVSAKWISGDLTFHSSPFIDSGNCVFISNPESARVVVLPVCSGVFPERISGIGVKKINDRTNEQPELWEISACTYLDILDPSSFEIYAWR